MYINPLITNKTHDQRWQHAAQTDHHMNKMNGLFGKKLLTTH